MATSNFGPRSQNQAVTGVNQKSSELLNDQISIRFMRDDDNDLLKSFFWNLSPSARFRRFMSSMRDVSDSVIQHLSAVDQDSHVAYLAETTIDGRSVMIAEARYVVEPSRTHECEFAIAVTDMWQGYGIGRELLGLLEQHAARSGRRELTADTLPENNPMIGLARRCGFSVGRNQHDFRVRKLTKQVALR